MRLWKVILLVIFLLGIVLGLVFRGRLSNNGRSGAVSRTVETSVSPSEYLEYSWNLVDAFDRPFKGRWPKKAVDLATDVRNEETSPANQDRIAAAALRQETSDLLGPFKTHKNNCHLSIHKVEREDQVSFRTGVYEDTSSVNQPVLVKIHSSKEHADFEQKLVLANKTVGGTLACLDAADWTTERGVKQYAVIYKAVKYSEIKTPGDVTTAVCLAAQKLLLETRLRTIAQAQAGAGVEIEIELGFKENEDSTEPPFKMQSGGNKVKDVQCKRLIMYVKSIGEPKDALFSSAAFVKRLVHWTLLTEDANAPLGDLKRFDHIPPHLIDMLADIFRLFANAAPPYLIELAHLQATAALTGELRKKLLEKVLENARVAPLHQATQLVKGYEKFAEIEAVDFSPNFQCKNWATQDNSSNITVLQSCKLQICASAPYHLTGNVQCARAVDDYFGFSFGERLHVSVALLPKDSPLAIADEDENNGLDEEIMYKDKLHQLIANHRDKETHPVLAVLPVKSLEKIRLGAKGAVENSEEVMDIALVVVQASVGKGL